MPRMAREQYRPRAFSHEGRITSHAAVKTWSTTGAVVIAALFLTNWPTYQYVVMGGATPLWYYALPAVIVLPIFFAKPENVLRVCREPLFWWFVFYVASGAVWLVLSQDFMEEHQPHCAGSDVEHEPDRKSTRLNSSHPSISYADFCLKNKILS